MFQPLLSFRLVGAKFQRVGDGRQTFSGMVKIRYASDLDSPTIDEERPQRVLSIGRFDLARVADVNNLGNRIAAATNRLLQKTGQLVRERDLIGFGHAAQVHRA